MVANHAASNDTPHTHNHAENTLAATTTCEGSVRNEKGTEKQCKVGPWAQENICYSTFFKALTFVREVLNGFTTPLKNISKEQKSC